MVFWFEGGAGVDCKGDDVGWRLSSDVVVAFTSFESSNAGTSGSDGMSFFSSASMRRHSLEGVSSRAIATEGYVQAVCFRHKAAERSRAEPTTRSST